MKNLFVFYLLSITSLFYGQTLSISPQFESVGLKIVLPSGFDPNQTVVPLIQYKKTSELLWLTGFHLDRITIQSVEQFRGSLFGLEENTVYEVKIVLDDTIAGNPDVTLPTTLFSTKSSPSFATSSNVKWVSPAGTGTAYTSSNPGNFKSLLQSGSLTCGATVLLMDGTYTDYDIGWNINFDCTENTPIVIKAADGAFPVFDGAYVGNLNWAQSATDINLYSATLPANCDYTNVLVVNGKMMYPYPTLSANTLFGNYNLNQLNFGADGFVRDNATILLKTQTGIDPNSATVVISKAFRWLTIYGNNHSPFIHFQGIKVKNYGKSKIVGTTSYQGMAADLRILNQVVFDNCEFENNNADIRFDGSCNNLLIQNCRFFNETGLFTHAMVKKSNDETGLISTSLGRGKETAAVKLDMTNDFVARGNHFKGTNSGIESYFSSGFIEEVDIYDNLFENNFDAIECDGLWSNLRVWGNEFISPMAAFSIAPPKIGPRYFYRNVIHHLKMRSNESDDPYYTGCTPSTDYLQAGIGIKTNSGPILGDSSNLYFINNTFHSEDSLGFAFTFWEGEWKTLDFINNIFYHDKHEVGFFHSLANKPHFHMKWVNNNLYSNEPSQPLLVAVPIHGNFNCQYLYNSNLLQNDLSTISGSSKITFTSTLSVDPNFISFSDFELAPNSSMIDAGVIVPGFHDYNNLAPDLGAKENMTIGLFEISPENGLIVFPNPTQGGFAVDVKSISGNKELKMFDLSGKEISIIVETQESKLLVNERPSPGIYVLQLSTKEKIYFSKIVIQ
jgi:Secretion system C-terminal sorting domain/Right handed beta helix region